MSNLFLAKSMIFSNLSPFTWGTCKTFSLLFWTYYGNYFSCFLTFFVPLKMPDMYSWFAVVKGGKYTSPSSSNILQISFLLLAFAVISFTWMLRDSIWPIWIIITTLLTIIKYLIKCNFLSEINFSRPK